ncbi:hypothetical protein B3286c2_0548 [Brucella vulpis]|uniref:hypothetical protein n=1 Tax=Brucella vulpis TaxID=981386 RepID=UPI00073A8DFF|nr:hypothetical protein BF3285c2_0553 [Brucella vulpis]CUW51565.1 hypothetical protein B3286c2_0548 [Brucella vulpis]
MKNPSIFGSSQKRGVLIPICSRFESVTFRESEAILTLLEVCQQSDPAKAGFFWSYLFASFGFRLKSPLRLSKSSISTP